MTDDDKNAGGKEPTEAEIKAAGEIKRKLYENLYDKFEAEENRRRLSWEEHAAEYRRQREERRQLALLTDEYKQANQP
jgi:hypothetical protein